MNSPRASGATRHTNAWRGRGEDKPSVLGAAPVTESLEALTAEVDDLLREWGGEGPVGQALQDAIASEHEALVLRRVGLARAEGRSLGWLAGLLRDVESVRSSMAILPPAAYRARRLGRPDPGGTWHRATLSRIFNRYAFCTQLAARRQALARIVREAVLPDLYRRGADWAAGQLNRARIPTELQTRRALVGLGAGAGRWSGKRLKVFLVSTSPALLQAPAPAAHQAAAGRRPVARAWPDDARDAHRAACRARIAPSVPPA